MVIDQYDRNSFGRSRTSVWNVETQTLVCVYLVMFSAKRSCW